jgi:Protein of unknown function (DUF433)
MTIRVARIANHRDPPYVERRPGVCGGEPVIVGTRFPVRSVVTNVYRLGLMPEEICGGVALLPGRSAVTNDWQLRATEASAWNAGA